ncbi:hypothetical protein HYH03_004385 [Edaphochlamys debaryana]|uniref:Leucine-binding protein domain-containing protein n=1 Tax=Edaphochlamys debaryana TaxID=47281 RepID=A0A835YB89_9CHLO|nr:hypothetical protein HYH03_004385 [Edaphochlamys debaryana]|eukprot:KAG2497646.1 hypothetical protein HYH03_004385 [Edaphochlamys debaryana]
MASGRIALATAAALLLALAPAVLAQPEGLKIGVVHGPLGDSSGVALAVSTVNGAMMAANDRGYKIALKNVEGGCGNVSEVVTDLVKTHKVAAIIGTFCSGALIAAGDTIAALKVPVITTFSGAKGVAQLGPYVHRTTIVGDAPQIALMKPAAQEYKKVAFIYDDQLISTDFYAVAIKVFEENGGTATISIQIKLDGTIDEYKAAVKEALDSKPDAVYVMTTSAFPDVAMTEILKAIRAEDPAFPILAGQNLNPGVVEAAKVTDADGTVTAPLIAGIWTSSDLPFPKADARYKEAFGINILPSLNGGNQGQTYDAVHAIITAALELGWKNATPGKLNAKMSSLSFSFKRYSGLKGKFDRNGDLIGDQALWVYGINGEMTPAPAPIGGRR